LWTGAELALIVSHAQTCRQRELLAHAPGVLQEQAPVAEGDDARRVDEAEAGSRQLHGIGRRVAGSEQGHRIRALEGVQAPGLAHEGVEDVVLLDVGAELQLVRAECPVAGQIGVGGAGLDAVEVPRLLGAEAQRAVARGSARRSRRGEDECDLGQTRVQRRLAGVVALRQLELGGEVVGPVGEHLAYQRLERLHGDEVARAQRQ
jgi:hypothetical protein